MSETPSLDLTALERLLLRVAPHKSVPELMGTLTALATAPAAPHPSQWLLTLTDDARFDDEDDARAFLAQVLAAFREIDGHLQVHEEVAPDPTDRKAVAQWCHGYFQAARSDTTWSADTDAMRRLMPIALLAGELDRVDDEQIHAEPMRDKWTAALGSLVASLYAHWADARASHTPPPPSDAALDDAAQEAPLPFRRDAPKLGRNAPCHCGSGKKFKHCHGRG